VKKTVKPAAQPADKKKVSIAPKKKPTPVKKDRVKPEDTIDKAIKRLEKDLAASPRPNVDTVADRIKRLERETRDDAPPGKAAVSEHTGTQEGRTTGSAYDVSLVDRYRHNVGMEIREQWAFSEQLAAGRTDLITKVTFEVMPDGEIRGVRITRRSGNDYMDSSATMAIVKASPVRPHPPGLNRPFIEVKLEFTPKGLE
jgi:colicin import membrane protein